MMPRRLWMAAAVWLAGGCLISTTPDSSDGETHFLQLCDASSPCGAPYECVCGHCTLTCDAPSACDILPGAACAEASLMPADGSCTTEEPEALVCVPVGDAGGASSPLVSTVTLSSWFDGDPILGTVYRAQVLELDEEGNLHRTGEQLVSDPETGSAVLVDPSFEEDSLAFHILGASYEIEDERETIEFETYDSIVLNFSWARGDRRLRVPLVEMAKFEQAIANVEPRIDRAALTGHVYWGAGNEIEGSVGCAQIYLDDDTSGGDRNAGQRYLADNRLPTTLEELSQTGRGGGFYFGNLAPGDHRLRVTLDDGETFIAKSDVKVTFTRQDALGPLTMMLYQLDIHVDTTSDPTPESCPR